MISSMDLAKLVWFTSAKNCHVIMECEQHVMVGFSISKLTCEVHTLRVQGGKK